MIRLIAIRPRSLLFAITSVCLAVLTVAAPAAAQGRTTTAFQASFNETSSYVACPPGTPTGYVCATGSGTGQSAALGSLTETFYSAIDATHPDASGALTVYSFATLVTATGDQLYLATIGSFNPATGVDSETFQVIGGTGTYKSASGNGTILTTLTGSNGTTNTSTSAYAGTVTYR